MEQLGDGGPRVRALVADGNLVIRRGLRSVLEGSRRVTVVAETADAAETVRRTEGLSPDVVLVGTWTHDREPPPVDRLSQRSRVLVLSHHGDVRPVERALREGAVGYLIYGQFEADDLVEAVVHAGPQRPYLSPGAVAALVRTLRKEIEPAPPGPRHLTATPPIAAIPAEMSSVPASRPPLGGRRIMTAAVAPMAGRGSGPGRLSRREVELMEHMLRGHTNREIAQTLYISEKTVKNHVNNIYTKLDASSRAEAIALWLRLRGTIGGLRLTDGAA